MQKQPDGFTEIYRAQYPAVFRFALHMTGDEVKAAEVAQDVFVWLIDHENAFDPARGSLGAFLNGVTRKFLQRLYREEKRWVELDENISDPAIDEPVVDVDALSLRAAIALLPLHYREAVVLCDLEEKSYEEAAALLDCAVGTVRSRLHRARALLIRKLTVEGCVA